jgi:citrate synthase
VLRQYAQQLAARTGESRWFEISAEIERVMLANTKVFPNVDFYSGTCYYSMGIPIELFTPIFACSRVVGWTAHILEQWSNNRLIRPRADYRGPQRRDYIPIDQREV